MTWDEVCALDSRVLLETVAQRCVVSVTINLNVGSWGHVMPLAWHYGIDVLAPDSSGEAWVRIPAGHIPAIRCRTQIEARLAICQLALWLATQQEDITQV